MTDLMAKSLDAKLLKADETAVLLHGLLQGLEILVDELLGRDEPEMRTRNAVAALSGHVVEIADSLTDNVQLAQDLERKLARENRPFGTAAAKVSKEPSP
ncbi:hypothetical protein M3P21_08670 [Ruegeria sp. 2012CJ41-6]|uniref:Uncharacterized protein n=1 Tax=Ruegeria spongiae TaxID=2942209 RepID=A0ABT0Q1B0_9RHOB|nr:hypothetical protein [Ruegeria spongiae]MCL6283610.1 hypothetical protein [Ruegeria spongiae]